MCHNIHVKELEGNRECWSSSFARFETRSILLAAVEVTLAALPTFWGLFCLYLPSPCRCRLGLQTPGIRCSTFREFERTHTQTVMLCIFP